MPKVVIYTTRVCPYCVRAKQLFQQLNVAYEEIDVSNDQETRLALVERTGQRTVPQIFINDQSVGGFDDVYKLHTQGKLDALLNSPS